jgi:hypothetical protein
MAEARLLLQRVTDELNDLLLRCYRAEYRQDVLRSRWLAVNWKDVQPWDVKTARAAAFRLALPTFRPMGHFVEESTEMVKPWEQGEKQWPVYGVNNKEGVVFSHYQKGKDFNAAYKRIREGWFFHNPTRSSVGSLGIVPAVPADAITSPEYQVWRIRQGLVPGYVATLVTTPFFIELIQFHRVGAVKQRLYVENLMSIRIPVLADADQYRIAQTREQALSRIAEAEHQTEEAEADVEAMILGVKAVT